MDTKVAKTAVASQRTTLVKVRDAIIVTLAALLLLLAQSAYWINHTIFDKESFTSITSSVLLTEETRSAVATTITDQALADRPVVKRLIGNNITALVSGLLATDLAAQATNTIIDRTYTYLTSDSSKVIAFDLLPLKEPLEKIINALESQGREIKFDPASIPDSIVLFNPKNMPDFYQFSLFTLWLGPLAWISTVLLFSLYIYLRRTVYARAVYITGSAIIIASCIGLLVGPLIRPPVIAMVPIPSMRSVVDNLIAALLQPFNQQMILTISVAAVILILFALRIHILRWSQQGIKKLSDLTGHATTSTKK